MNVAEWSMVLDISLSDWHYIIAFWIWPGGLNGCYYAKQISAAVYHWCGLNPAEGRTKYLSAKNQTVKYTVGLNVQMKKNE
jgi:hypothetical protein